MSWKEQLAGMIEKMRAADPGLIGGTAAAALLGGSDEAEAGNKKALNDLIKKMRGRPVEEIEAELAKMYDLSYRGGHTAPIQSDSTAKITELDKIYPSDIYGPNARRYYGDMVPYDWQSMNILQSVRGKENMPVTMYRALPKQSSLFDELKNLQAQQAYILKYGKVPSNIETSLNKSQVFEKNYDRIDALKKELETNPEVIKRPEIIPGDWVTLSKDYAKQHAEGLENPTVIQKTVPAGELYTDANSIHEQGWWPFKAALAAPMAALSTAQEVNPLNLLGSIVKKYRGAQEAMADKIVETVNPYPKQKPDEATKNIGRMALDPVNLIGGPVGDMLMGIDLMSNFSKKEEQK